MTSRMPTRPARITFPRPWSRASTIIRCREDWRARFATSWNTWPGSIAKAHGNGERHDPPDAGRRRGRGDRYAAALCPVDLGIDALAATFPSGDACGQPAGLPADRLPVRAVSHAPGRVAGTARRLDPRLPWGLHHFFQFLSRRLAAARERPACHGLRLHRPECARWFAGDLGRPGPWQVMKQAAIAVNSASSSPFLKAFTDETHHA